MNKTLSHLKTLLGEIADLNYIQAALAWDQQTYMPPGASRDRADQLSTLAHIIHLKSTSKELGRLLDKAEAYTQSLDPDCDDARLVKVARYDFNKRTSVPPAWIKRFVEVTSIAHLVWEHAREKADFSLFQPHLEQIVDLRREYAGFFAPYEHIYDPLLDEFERGMKTAEVQAIFAALRPQQVALVQVIRECAPVDDSFLRQPFAEQQQWDFTVEVLTQLGYDWQRGRQDRSAHPFSTSLGFNDVRITTRFLPQHGVSSLFSSMHEFGHALYEMEINPALIRTPLAAGASMAIHESQSRLWENMVGRSLPFWHHFYPRLQKAFPSQLENTGLETFYKGINKVEPSLIRVEADEVTYNLHVMLRLELEIALIEGSLKVADLPQAWNARMQDYLGLTPPTVAQGVLQDVHWSGGTIGYFPTYAIGNLVSAQLWECLRRDMPDLDAQISSGEFSNLRQWLRQNIHQHGAKFEPQELVQKITGSKINPQPYLHYLNDKFSAIYNLSQ